MAELAKRRATYEDLKAVPPPLVAEIIHGALVTQPRPTPRHSAAAMSLGGELTSPFQKGRGGPGGWIFLVEPELHLGRDVVVPDIAGWRRERLPVFPDTAWIETPPDWVCEVLSESTEVWDRGKKRDICGSAGVSFLWFVDPRAQLLEAFQLVAAKWLLIASIGADDEVRVPPFNAVSFSLGLLWPYDAPKPATP